MVKGRSIRFADVGNVGEDELLGELTAAATPSRLAAAPASSRPVLYHQGSSSRPVSSHISSQMMIPTEQVEMIRRVWGEVVCGDGAKVAAILRTRSVVAEETSRVLQSAINIGRSLNELKIVLEPEEFDRGMRASREVFPGWSQGNMSKLMNIARFIDERDFPPDSVPQSYTTLYEFTTLDEAQFQKAQELQLFRPDVQRSAVQQFKKASSKSSVIDAAFLKSSSAKELVLIDLRLAELQSEMRELRKRRAMLVK